MRICAFLSALLLCAAAGRSGDLLLSRFPKSPHAVVYDLPGLPPDLAAKVPATLKQNFPNSELIDAATPEESLRTKLTGDFILLTLLDPKSRLLLEAAQLLPLKLENNVLHWADFSAPIPDLRVAFVGRNPYGSGHAFVLAFGGINMNEGITTPDYSFMIRNSKDLLFKGTYDDHYTPVNREQISPADALADANELFATLERFHPDLFARTPEAEYRRIKKDTLAAITARKDPLRTGELASLLAYASASVRDGHTNFNWPINPGNEVTAGILFPPFLLESENGRFFIASARDKSLEGAELLAINGRSTPEFLRPVLDRISGETLTWRAAQFTGDQGFWLWLTNVYGSPAECCKLKLRAPDGVEREVSAAPISFGEFRRLPSKTRPRSRQTEVKFLDSGKIALFNYPSFALAAAEKKRIDDIFRQIHEAKSEHLIIDLRGNGGGDSGMGDYIFRYIAARPIDQASHMRIRVAPESVEDYKKHGGALPPNADALIAQLMGRTLDTAEEPLKSLNAVFDSPAQTTPAPPENAFHGTLWLLIDNNTFSSANLFTVSFRDYALGKILGYESGEPGINCGQPYPFTLPHSHFHYRVSNREYYPPKGRPGDDVHGILPDIPFDRAHLAPYAAEPDPGLAFTLNLIRSRDR